MKYILLILLLSILLFSCSTTKYVDKVRVETDSTAVRERDSVISLYKLDSAAWVNTIEMLSNNTIIFQDTGSTRIEYYPDGNIKVVEGRVKNLSSQLSQAYRQAGYWKSLYDSAAAHSSKDSIQVKTEYVTVTKEKKTRFLPWWLVLVAAGVLIIGWRMGKIKWPK